MSIGYRMMEVPTQRKSWVWALRDMRVGEEMEVDLNDLPSIKVAMTRIKKQTGGTVVFKTRAGFVTRIK